MNSDSNEYRLTVVVFEEALGAPAATVGAPEAALLPEGALVTAAGPDLGRSVSQTVGGEGGGWRPEVGRGLLLVAAVEVRVEALEYQQKKY